MKHVEAAVGQLPGAVVRRDPHPAHLCCSRAARAHRTRVRTRARCLTTVPARPVFADCAEGGLRPEGAQRLLRHAA
eukprot:950849-Prymnesium_polylepis.1